MSAAPVTGSGASAYRLRRIEITKLNEHHRSAQTHDRVTPAVGLRLSALKNDPHLGRHAASVMAFVSAAFLFVHVKTR